MEKEPITVNGLKNLKLITENKKFLNEDLEKNVYLHGKNYLINLNILNFAINTKIKSKDFFDNLDKILKSKIHKFSIDGKYLIKNGMQEGPLMGKAIKKIEDEWIKNRFTIKKDRINEIIRSYSN